MWGFLKLWHWAIHLPTCGPLCILSGQLGAAQMAQKMAKNNQKNQFYGFHVNDTGLSIDCRFFPIFKPKYTSSNSHLHPRVPSVSVFGKSANNVVQRVKNVFFHIFECGDPQIGCQWYMKLPGRWITFEGYSLNNCGPLSAIWIGQWGPNMSKVYLRWCFKIMFFNQPNISGCHLSPCSQPPIWPQMDQEHPGDGDRQISVHRAHPGQSGGPPNGYICIKNGMGISEVSFFLLLKFKN